MTPIVMKKMDNKVKTSHWPLTSQPPKKRRQKVKSPLITTRKRTWPKNKKLNASEPFTLKNSWTSQLIREYPASFSRPRSLRFQTMLPRRPNLLRRLTTRVSVQMFVISWLVQFLALRTRTNLVQLSNSSTKSTLKIKVLMAKSPKQTKSNLIRCKIFWVCA